MKLLRRMMLERPDETQRRHRAAGPREATRERIFNQIHIISHPESRHLFSAAGLEPTRVVAINIDEPRGRAASGSARSACFSPSFCSGSGAKAQQEFGEARAALIRLARPSGCSRSQEGNTDPKFTGRARGGNRLAAKRDLFWVSSLGTCSSFPSGAHGGVPFWWPGTSVPDRSW